MPMFNVKKELDLILRPSNGLFEYREQIVNVLHRIGGFGIAHAELVTKSVCKKQQGIGVYKNMFMYAAQNRGMEKKELEDLWDKMLKVGPKVRSKSLDTSPGAKLVQVKK
jgi:DNA polymerase III alpha subunit